MKVGVLSVALLVCGCFSPDFPDGVTPCGAAGECPGDLLCAADRLCYHAGNVPNPCGSGYVRSRTGSCVDIDECVSGTAVCDANATCTNTPGGYSCACNQGWSGDGRSCADVDECQATPSPCDPHATCANSVGSFTCTCGDGYAGDGKSCNQDFVQVTTSGDHACGRRSDGALFCWGDNGAGQLGVGKSVAEAHAPAGVGGDRWSQVAAGNQFTCGIKNDGTLWCWGSNSCGVVGNAAPNMFCDSSQPVYEPYPTGGGDKWRSLVAGPTHVCAVRADAGALYCWGKNDHGELGTNDMQWRTAPAAVAQTPTGWDAVALGRDHTCGLRSGRLYCWGSNFQHQLGDGTTEQQLSPKPIGASTSWTAVAAGDLHTCALQSDRSLFCWGDDQAGQLGLGDAAVPSGTSAPTVVPGTQQWASVAAGGLDTCGRTTAGALYCFGDGNFGQIGDGSFVRRSSPAAVGSATDWATVAVGFHAACAAKSGGQMYCWGQNQAGAIGAGTGGIAATPADVASAGFVQLAAGAKHQCGIKGDHTLWCWGNNFDGQLGIGSGDIVRDAPDQVAGSWSFVAAGHHSSCAVRMDGQLLCWGANFSGELGNGSNDAGTRAPVEVMGGGSWLRVDVHQSHACGLQTGGTLWCWGLAASGQLGIGAPPSAFLDAPQQVSGTGYTSVAVGETHTCAVRGGDLVCFGSNTFGQMGNGLENDTPTLTPATVSSSHDWTAVTAGKYHTCALRGAGNALYCWGYNFFGQIGNGASGSGVDALAPVAVAPPPGRSWRAVDAGQSTTCAIASDGNLSCWGSNDDALLGNGNAGKLATTPVPISSAGDFVGLSLGDETACALHGGGYACWGQQLNGEFGDGTAFYETPAPVKEP